MILEFKTVPIAPKAAKTGERRAALSRADHALRIEGLRSSDFAAPLFEALARGEITPDELRDQLTSHHRSDLG